MDFVPFNQSKEEKNRDRKLALRCFYAGAVAIAQLPALLATGVLSFTTGSGAPLLLSVSGAMVGVVTMIPVPFVIQNDWALDRLQARTEHIREAFNEHYGLKLTPDQFAALSYPRDNPGSGFQTYGSIKVHDQVGGGNFLERTLYLTSTDGEFVLSESRDGKRFKELKPVRQAVEGTAASSPQALEASVPSEASSELSAPVAASA